MEIVFDNPQYLLFLLSLPVLVILHFLTIKYARGRILQFANFIAMSRVTKGYIEPRNSVQLVIRLLTLSFIVFAVSGLNVYYVGSGAYADYVIAIDVSSSMESTDISPTRLDAAKDAASEFIDSASLFTSVGLVSFSGNSQVVHELSKDKTSVKRSIDSLDISPVGGTDLSAAIISSTNMLIQQKNSRSIVLITDGRSTSASDLQQAVDYADENNVQIFTIAVGTDEGNTFEGLNISFSVDEETLQEIAALTDGRYVLAESREEISRAYQEIMNVGERRINMDLTVTLMLLALIASFADWMLVNTVYKRIP